MKNKIFYQVVDVIGEEVCICTSEESAKEFSEACGGKYFEIRG